MMERELEQRTTARLARAIQHAATIQCRLSTWSIITRRDHEALLDDLSAMSDGVRAIIDEVLDSRAEAPEHAGAACEPGCRADMGAGLHKKGCRT